ncbi:MAG: DUF302 domain-containing protein [Actinomycetota bacterium]|nr:DUF302 domain-containing protein [Actinomycetota bacterium]
MAAIEHSAADITTKDSPRPFADTVTRRVDLVIARGMKDFDVVDQAAEARAVGRTLRPTTLVVFGNPLSVMAAPPLAALDLAVFHPDTRTERRARCDEFERRFPSTGQSNHWLERSSDGLSSRRPERRSVLGRPVDLRRRGKSPLLL